jgi:hypothetical protein
MNNKASFDEKTCESQRKNFNFFHLNFLEVKKPQVLEGKKKIKTKNHKIGIKRNFWVFAALLCMYLIMFINKNASKVFIVHLKHCAVVGVAVVVFVFVIIITVFVAIVIVVVTVGEIGDFAAIFLFLQLKKLLLISIFIGT